MELGSSYVFKCNVDFILEFQFQWLFGPNGFYVASMSLDVFELGLRHVLATDNMAWNNNCTVFQAALFCVD